jgi:hypothetical protein
MKYSLHNGVLSAKTVSCKLIITYYHGNYKGNWVIGENRFCAFYELKSFRSLAFRIQFLENCIFGSSNPSTQKKSKMDL